MNWLTRFSEARLLNNKLLVSIAVVAFFQGSTAFAAPALLSYGATTPTVAGVSSGGFMAVQLGVAYSATFKGVGVFAGGPYYCAADNASVAVTTCMSNNPAITSAGISSVEYYTNLWASYGWNDSTGNMANQKVYMYSGRNDTVVVQAVMNWLQVYFQNYMSSSNILYNNSSSAGHSWVTWKTGSGINSCSTQGGTYINNCSNDPEHDMLQKFYGSVSTRASSATGQLLSFDQAALTPGGNPGTYSLASTGYVYVPSYCASNSGCKVVVALHGCQQSYSTIGNAFITNSGLNEYADTNHLLIVYPQLVASTYPSYNPQGCWDWWGYTGTNYPIKSGAQMTFIKNVVNRVKAAHY